MRTALTIFIGWVALSFVVAVAWSLFIGECKRRDPEGWRE